MNNEKDINIERQQVRVYKKKQKMLLISCSNSIIYPGTVVIKPRYAAVNCFIWQEESPVKISNQIANISNSYHGVLWEAYSTDIFHSILEFDLGQQGRVPH